MKTVSVVSLLSGLFLLAGCGGGGDRAVTVTWAAGKDATGAQRKLVRMFNERDPGFTVKLIEMPESAGAQRDSYVTYLSAGDSSIDVYALDVIWPAEFAAAGWILPLDDRFGAGERVRFLDGPVESCTYEGSVYAVPWFMDAGVLYYRTDLLEQEGLEYPKTWAELERQAALVGRKHGVNGFVFQAEQYEGLMCNFLEYVWSFGGEMLGDDGAPGLDSPAALDAMRFWHGLIHESGVAPEGVLTYKEEESRQVFTSGNAVFLRNWPYVWKLAQDADTSQVAGRVGIAPLPSDPPHESASVLGGWNLAVSRFSEHPEEAWRFIEFMTGPEAQKIYALEGGRLPTRKAVYDDEEVLAFAPYYRDLYPIFVRARPRPAAASYARMSDAVQIEVHQSLTGRKSPAEALADANRALKRIQGGS